MTKGAADLHKVRETLHLIVYNAESEDADGVGKAAAKCIRQVAAIRDAAYSAGYRAGRESCYARPAERSTIQPEERT